MLKLKQKAVAAQSIADLKDRYGEDAIITEFEKFVLVHLDNPSEDTILSRLKVSKIRKSFPRNCPASEIIREEGCNVIFDEWGECIPECKQGGSCKECIEMFSESSGHEAKSYSNLSELLKADPLDSLSILSISFEEEAGSLLGELSLTKTSEVLIEEFKERLEKFTNHIVSAIKDPNSTYFIQRLIISRISLQNLIGDFLYFKQKDEVNNVAYNSLLKKCAVLDKLIAKLLKRGPAK